MRRGTTSTVVIAACAAVAALTVLIWGSGSGGTLIGAPQGTWGPPAISMDPLPVTRNVSDPPIQEGQPRGDGPAAVDWLLLSLLVIIVATVLIIIRWLVTRSRREVDVLTAEDDEELVALLEASGEDVRYRALSESDPRNAVVACWVALEEAVRRSGLRDDPAETASELTERVLARWHVDPGAIRDLSDAYREARFSRHPVTEQQRDRAIAALERIHEDLRQRVLDEQIRAAEAERAAAAQREAETDAAGSGPGR